jgi:hypothetical protein
VTTVESSTNVTQRKKNNDKKTKTNKL